MTALEDEPIGYELTEAGWEAARSTMTTTEAAAYVGIDRSYITAAARYGDLRGVKVARAWLLDRESVEAFARRRRPSLHGRLPAAPLLRLVEQRGGAAAVGVRPHSAEEKMLERARRNGWVTEAAGDHLAVTVLGVTPHAVWGA